MSKNDISAQDLELFKRATIGTKPLKSSNTVVFKNFTNTTDQNLQEKRDHATGQNINHRVNFSDQYTELSLFQDDSFHLKNGHSRKIIKDLKRIKWPIEDKLDLHGYNTDQARNKLIRFLDSCLDHKLRCVLIVHGKGYGSKDNKPVLKNLVRKWLAQMQAVIAYVQCSPALGGSGAVLVLLSSKNR